MLFNSFEFLLFFPAVTALYFAVGLRARWVVLFVASSLFYMAFIPKYVLIIYGTILVDYVAGLAIERAHGKARAAFLALSIAVNVGALATFKYFNFFVDNANALARFVGIESSFSHWSLILPIGLSFHTFQAMSYTIEVYRGRQPAERNLLVYALYVMFYPQLVAGPIERPQNIIHQLKQLHRWDAARATHGLQLMLWGFFKKIVVADRLAQFVDATYAHPTSWPGPVLIVATLAFAIQIYADFSGYSDIALGAAEVLGIRLMTNFAQPYLSTSVSEFWKRWHISLSSWFRDYFYVPLGGSRISPWRTRFNLLATFAVSGLWHGANWTFVIWGLLNGLYLVAEKAGGFESGRGRARLLLTFGQITLGWVFFRAATLHDAYAVLRGFGRDLPLLLQPSQIKQLLSSHELDIHLTIGFVGALVLLVADRMMAQKKLDIGKLLSSVPSVPRWATYYALGAAIIALGFFGK